MLQISSLISREEVTLSVLSHLCMPPKLPPAMAFQNKRGTCVEKKKKCVRVRVKQNVCACLSYEGNPSRCWRVILGWVILGRVIPRMWPFTWTYPATNANSPSCGRRLSLVKILVSIRYLHCLVSNLSHYLWDFWRYDLVLCEGLQFSKMLTSQNRAAWSGSCQTL